MKKQIYYLIISCGFVFKIQSQDFHFSQFNENPALINPALTGAISTQRASLVYKDQWRSVTTPYTSYGVSFESKFKSSNWETVDPRRSMTFKKSYSRMAGGISVYNDQAGSGKMGTLQSNLSFAMFFPLSKLTSLSLGLQGGVVQRKLQNNKLIYPDQYSSGNGYDPNIPSAESGIQQSFIYPDLAAGAMWSYAHNERSIAANNEFKAQIGFSVYHINRPHQTFILNSSDRIYRKYVFHGNILIGIPNSMVAIVPTWIAQFQGPNKEIIAGLLFKYYLNDDSKYTGLIKRSAISFGAYYRNIDALIAHLLIEKGRYSVGISYDINVSGLARVSTARGGFEITLRYVTPNPFLYQRKSKSMFD